MNLNDLNALFIVLFFIIIVFISITMDFKKDKQEKEDNNND